MNARNKNKYFWLFIALLLFIILILLFFIKFGRIESKYLVPTGNVDIFNIDINCKCENEDKCDKEDNTNTYPVWDEQKYKNEFNKIYVDDINGNYIYQQNLKIFNNAAYEYMNKISPGVSSTYFFVVHNSSDINVKYYIEMIEESEYDINLKYRLKRNGNYIIGSKDKWVSAAELKTSFSKLEVKSSDKYSLDWKWEYDSGSDIKDTYIGENMTDLYKLNVRFYFEQD